MTLSEIEKAIAEMQNGWKESSVKNLIKSRKRMKWTVAFLSVWLTVNIIALAADISLHKSGPLIGLQLLSSLSLVFSIYIQVKSYRKLRASYGAQLLENSWV